MNQATDSRTVRAPAWSGMLTGPLTRLIRPRWQDPALTAIKTLHTLIFASVGFAIAMVLWDGVQQRPRRRTVMAGAIVIAESAIYASNNQVCPLTPLAEQLGAARGSVADIFLPGWASRRIPIVGSSALVIGSLLNARAWLRGRTGGSWGGLRVSNP
jgi:hypothetical protein